MSDLVRVWIEGFLQRRELDRPDGRALFAYQCSRQEFDSLSAMLARCHSSNRMANGTILAFVLYASEWWQRKYSGGTWTWESILESIGWETIHYPDLYEPVRRAWRWWRVDLVRLPGSTRYLSTFACQGGLPLALVVDPQSSVTRFLRAVLQHVGTFQQFADPMDLAQDQQHLLRPPTLRRDYVFRLAADLAEAVLELHDDALGENPLSALDEVRPDWRRVMPLDLEDLRAADLLVSLLRDASRNQSTPADEFRIERFLSQTAMGWRLGARIQLPTTIPIDVLSRQLDTPGGQIPERLQVRTAGERARILGVYGADHDSFHLVPSSRSNSELWDEDAAKEIQLQFYAGRVVGKPVLPRRGSVLGELPWSFRFTDDYVFIGEGSVANRAPSILVLVPDGYKPDYGEIVTSMTASETSPDYEQPVVRILDRTLWRVSQDSAIETDSGRCIIRPSSRQRSEEEYRISGARLYDLISPYPLFFGIPKLRRARAGQVPRLLPAKEVSWRQRQGEWQSSPNRFGLWEVRHLHRDELRFLGKAAILPEEFSFSIEPGTDVNMGHFMLSNGEGVRVGGGGGHVDMTAEHAKNAIQVSVRAHDAANPPVAVQLQLHWAGTREITVQAPFPGHGGRFLREGKPVMGDLVVDDLYGVSAIGLSPDQTQQFRVEGELKAPDMDGLSRVAYFNENLRKSGVTHELALIEIRRAIELLLSASSSNDAHVALQVVDRWGQVHGRARVSRFSGQLECNADLRLVSVAPVSGISDDTVIEALPLRHPGKAAVPLKSPGVTGSSYCAVLPQDLDRAEPWLVVMRNNNRIHARPCRLDSLEVPPEGFRSIQSDAKSLADALAIDDEDLRVQGLSAAMDAMLDDGNVERAEADWDFLNESILQVEGLPASVLDIFRALVTKPRVLVRGLFRLESTPRRQLWHLEDELPFSWLLINREIWCEEARRAFEHSRLRLTGIVDDPEEMARDYVNSILSEGDKRLQSLITVATDVALRLENASVSRGFAEHWLDQRNEQTPAMIVRRSNLDDWPIGDGRKEWIGELGEIPESFWQHAVEHRARQPIFDTPVAAALCCFGWRPTERATFLVKRMRAHDPEWFDLAYSATWFKLASLKDELKRQR